MIRLEPILSILRLEENRKYGTFGALLIEGMVFCVTLEPPYKMNRKMVSCIPVGQYEAQRVPSEKFGEVYLIQDVPGRSSIEIHPGNTVYDTEGCIILGSSWGKLRSNNRAVLNSGGTFRIFMRALEGYPRVHISIKNAW